MNKNSKKTIEIKSLCDKILTFKIHEISEPKLSSSLTKKSKTTSLDEIKKTLIQMNSILKKWNIKEKMIY